MTVFKNMKKPWATLTAPLLLISLTAPGAILNLAIDPAINNAGAVAELINAIGTANASGQANSIELFPNGVYTLQTAHNFEYGPNGLPQIASDLTINGNSWILGGIIVKGQAEVKIATLSAKAPASNWV
jgi:hypothetical protein